MTDERWAVQQHAPVPPFLCQGYLLTAANPGSLLVFWKSFLFCHRTVLGSTMRVGWGYHSDIVGFVLEQREDAKCNVVVVDGN
ncbi:hypothetical protein CDAR_107041 [Caerostris darwini]|uniref:Uncharacterized protein n=1 Tax=Caerostris darwini TaxID=1538125 RepID=A0AAV4SYY9_9ARAC|nr:hypothetical protein CDAR_107041 [Caerostris darwini]